MNKHTKGYLRLPRNTLQLLKETNMDFADYGFYLFLVQLADWDRLHTSYAMVKKNDVELSQLSNCNPSTVCRRKQKLIRYGVIKINESTKLVEIINYEKFTSRVFIANTQDRLAESHSQTANTQITVAETQESEREIEHSFNSSFKDNLDLCESSLPLDDQEWINENIRE